MPLPFPVPTRIPTRMPTKNTAGASIPGHCSELRGLVQADSDLNRTNADVLKQGRTSLKKGPGLKQGVKKRATALKRGASVPDAASKKAVLTSKKISKKKTNSLKQVNVAAADVGNANYYEPMKLDPTVVANQHKAMGHLKEKSQLMIDSSDMSKDHTHFYLDFLKVVWGKGWGGQADRHGFASDDNVMRYFKDHLTTRKSLKKTSYNHYVLGIKHGRIFIETRGKCDYDHDVRKMPTVLKAIGKCNTKRNEECGEDPNFDVHTKDNTKVMSLLEYKKYVRVANTQTKDDMNATLQYLLS
jgi:hypothetical protein